MDIGGYRGREWGGDRGDRGREWGGDRGGGSGVEIGGYRGDNLGERRRLTEFKTTEL